jgi:hypothetical protein
MLSQQCFGSSIFFDTMSQDEPNVKALFLGTQLTLLAIFLVVLGRAVALWTLIGTGIVLAGLGSLTVFREVSRSSRSQENPKAE